MTTETNTPDLNTLLDAYVKACAHLKTVTAASLLKAFASQFKSNPAVKCMVWTQYTPYFNDGEPCTFRISGENPCRSRLPQADELSSWTLVAGATPPADDSPYPKQEYASDFLDAYEYTDPIVGARWGQPNPPEVAQASALESFRDALPEDLIIRIFGDGVRVFVWEGGLLTREYSHD